MAAFFVRCGHDQMKKVWHWRRFGALLRSPPLRWWPQQVRTCHCVLPAPDAGDPLWL